MKQITVACLVIVLIGSITSNSVWARGGGGHGGGGGGHMAVAGVGRTLWRRWDYGGGHYGGGWGYGHGGNYGHSSFGFYFGAPFYSYPYYSYPYQYPYYYPPAVVTVPVTPPVYIQQSPPVAQQYPTVTGITATTPKAIILISRNVQTVGNKLTPIPPAPR